jgi:glycerate-2-kinase
LRRCDAFPALLRADALVVTGPTGTNAADLVLALVLPVP